MYNDHLNPVKNMLMTNPSVLDGYCAVVASGPSIDNSINLLKSVRDKVTVIVTHSSCSVLLAEVWFLII